MDANSLLMNRFKMQCNKFSGTISKNLGKVKKRLVKEMIYGIQASKDVKLSNISRALMEPIALIKTEDRLSRNLSDEDLICTINHHIMRLADDKIDDTMVIAIDRQGDDIDLIRCFNDESLQFVTRLKMNRYLHYGKNTARQVKAERIDRHVELSHKAHIYVAKDGKEEFIHLTYGAVTVALPEYPDIWYTLVIVKGFGQQPMLLLTNKQVNINNNKQLWQIIEIYLTRWKCDECYRYIKQSYNMEDFRVLGYTSIRNITVLVHAIAYFTSIYLGISLKLKIMVQKIFILSKRFFGVPSFYNYAMADGIFELLRHSKQGIIGFKSRIGPNHELFQLSLFPD